jgi:hypothetical protein
MRSLFNSICGGGQNVFLRFVCRSIGSVYILIVGAREPTVNLSFFVVVYEIVVLVCGPGGDKENKKERERERDPVGRDKSSNVSRNGHVFSMCRLTEKANKKKRSAERDTGGKGKYKNGDISHRGMDRSSEPAGRAPNRPVGSRLGS